MDIPPRLKKTSNTVCKLKKSLYGLKQSPRPWFERFTKSTVKCAYHQSQRDHTLFIKHSSTNKITTLIVCVDNIIVKGNDFIEMEELKKKLSIDLRLKISTS